MYLLDTAKDIFDVILQVGAGTGLLYLVRWFWWRVNAWCEIVAMVSSFAVSIAILVLKTQGVVFSTHAALLTTVAITTVCWVATAYLGPETDRDVLDQLLAHGSTGGPGWARIREAAGRSAPTPAAAATTCRSRSSAGCRAAPRSGRRSSPRELSLWPAATGDSA